MGSLNFDSVGGYFWGYLNSETNNILRINWTGGTSDNYPLNFATNGNVYIYLRPTEHQTTLIIPDLPVNQIII
jgi:hypothetical protein